MGNPFLFSKCPYTRFSYNVSSIKNLLSALLSKYLTMQNLMQNFYICVPNFSYSQNAPIPKYSYNVSKFILKISQLITLLNAPIPKYISNAKYLR